MLRSEHLNLRALRIADLKFLNEWRNNLENKVLTQSYRLPVTTTLDEEWLKLKMSNNRANEVFFIIENIETEIPIGLIELTDIDYISGRAVWGLLIGDKSMRGRGLGSEALLLLFDYAFNILNLRKLNAYCLDFNAKLLNVLKKIGNVKTEGTLKEHYFLNGSYHDVIITSIFRNDFIKLYPKKNDTF